MSKREEVLKRERAVVGRFLEKEKGEIPDIPEWIRDDMLSFWEENLFFLHYIPEVYFTEDLSLPSFYKRPGKLFYKKKVSQKLSSRWILVDVRNRPQKSVLWINSNTDFLFDKIGVGLKKYLKKQKKQIHEKEYLKEVLKEKGFGSRFCLNVEEVRELSVFILKFLQLEDRKVRFPFYLEYNYLVNMIYSEWKESDVWEWLEDKLTDGSHLAIGRNVSSFGWDSPSFWSTILTFRPVVEVET
jgi:hypothetical protein